MGFGGSGSGSDNLEVRALVACPPLFGGISPPQESLWCETSSFSFGRLGWVRTSGLPSYIHFRLVAFGPGP